MRNILITLTDENFTEIEAVARRADRLPGPYVRHLVLESIRQNRIDDAAAGCETPLQPARQNGQKKDERIESV